MPDKKAETTRRARRIVREETRFEGTSGVPKPTRRVKWSVDCKTLSY